MRFAKAAKSRACEKGFVTKSDLFINDYKRVKINEWKEAFERQNWSRFLSDSSTGFFVHWRWVRGTGIEGGYRFLMLLLGLK